MRSFILALAITSIFCLDIQASDAAKIEKTLRQIYEKKGRDEALASLKKLFAETPNDAILHYLQAEFVDPKAAKPEYAQTGYNAKFFHYSRALEVLEKGYTNKYKVKNVSELQNKIAVKIREAQPLIKEYDYFTPAVGNPYCLKPIENPKTEAAAIRKTINKCAHEKEIDVEVEYRAPCGAYFATIFGEFTDLSKLKDLPISALLISGARLVDFSFLGEMPVTDLHLVDMEFCDFSQMLPKKLIFFHISMVDKIKHFSKIEEVKTLRYLMIYCNNISQKDLHALKTLKLQTLVLSGDIELTDLTFFKDVPLKTLIITSSKVSSDAVRSLNGHPTLSRLGLPKMYEKADPSILPKGVKISYRDSDPLLWDSIALQKRRMLQRNTTQEIDTSAEQYMKDTDAKIDAETGKEK